MNWFMNWFGNRFKLQTPLKFIALENNSQINKHVSIYTNYAFIERGSVENGLSLSRLSDAGLHGYRLNFGKALYCLIIPSDV